MVIIISIIIIIRMIIISMNMINLVIFIALKGKFKDLYFRSSSLKVVSLIFKLAPYLK